MGIIGLAGAATWLVSAAAAARSVRLPAGRGRSAVETHPEIAAVLGAIVIAAGALLGAAVLAAYSPVSDVMNVFFNLGQPVGLEVVTVSTVMPAVVLFGPLLVLAAIALALSRPAAPAVRAPSEEVAPLFPLVAPRAFDRAAAAVRAAAVPAQYRSLFNPRALENVAAGGSPLLWLASIIALAFAVTR